LEAVRYNALPIPFIQCQVLNYKHIINNARLLVCRCT
jgi:hypothetical protein